MTDSELDDLSQQFLVTLFEQTKGDVVLQNCLKPIGGREGQGFKIYRERTQDEDIRREGVLV